MAVCEVLLNVPPPEVIDHAPVVADPPTLAPLNISAEGLADWHTLSGPPGVTVGKMVTVTTAVPVKVALQFVVALVAMTEKVVEAAVKLPVGRLIGVATPVPATAVPTLDAPLYN